MTVPRQGTIVFHCSHNPFYGFQHAKGHHFLEPVQQKHTAFICLLRNYSILFVCIQNHRIMTRKNTYLIRLWKSISNTWFTSFPPLQ